MNDALHERDTRRKRHLKFARVDLHEENASFGIHPFGKGNRPDRQVRIDALKLNLLFHHPLENIRQTTTQDVGNQRASIARLAPGLIRRFRQLLPNSNNQRSLNLMRGNVPDTRLILNSRKCSHHLVRRPPLQTISNAVTTNG